MDPSGQRCRQVPPSEELWRLLCSAGGQEKRRNRQGPESRAETYGRGVRSVSPSSHWKIPWDQCRAPCATSPRKVSILSKIARIDTCALLWVLEQEIEMRILLMIVALLSLSACGGLGYGGVLGLGGASSEQIGADIYRVGARGNHFDRPSDLDLWILLKSAEVTRDAGHSKFVFLSGYQVAESDGFGPRKVVDKNATIEVFSDNRYADGYRVFDARKVLQKIKPLVDG